MSWSRAVTVVGAGVVMLVVLIGAILVAGGWPGSPSTISASDAVAAAGPVVQQHGSAYGILGASIARPSELQRDSEGRPLGPIPGARCSGLGLGRLIGKPFQVCLPRDVWIVHAQGSPGVPALTTQDDLYVFVDAHTGQVISSMESGPL